MTISEIAERTGLSIHTLRYYEKQGLIRDIARDLSGKRQYSITDFEWIQWIKRLKSTGMSIDKIRQFAELRTKGDSSFQQRRDMLSDHGADLTRQIKSLKSELAIVRYKVEQYDKKLLDLE